MEVMTQLEISVILAYLSTDDLNPLDEIPGRIAKMLSALRYSLLNNERK